MIAHVISRRPHLISGAVDTARSFADMVVAGLHNIDDPGLVAEVVTGTNYVDLTNAVLKASAAHAPATLRVDDDDYYPSDHAEIYDVWKPGHTVWGVVTIKGCDGTILKRDHPDMCAGVIPTNLVVTADRLGRVADSIRIQTEPIFVPTGVIKQVCLSDATWVHAPYWSRRIDCSHTQRSAFTESGA